jgi:cytidyltransferase-like protein
MASTKIINYKKTISLISDFKSQNKTVVYLSGAFDVIHIGHIEYLRRAKKYGDILFVGLESDEYIKAYKGVGRPVNKIKDRLSLLSELLCVDYVFELPLKNAQGIKKDTMYVKRYKELSPNVVVIWAGNNYLNKWRKQVREAKIIPKVIKFKADTSSTKTLKKLGLE